LSASKKKINIHEQKGPTPEHKNLGLARGGGKRKPNCPQRKKTKGGDKK